jgi:uncharacterized damage-inducible protein DinB
MYDTVAEILVEWTNEMSLTQRIFDTLTDESLSQQVWPEGRNLARIAWHIVTSIPEFLAQIEIPVPVSHEKDPVPTSAKAIAQAFGQVNADAGEAIKSSLKDEVLPERRQLFGREMSNGYIVLLLIKHTIHHRAQMMVLMRQAGLTVPGVYGPAKEEWSRFGQEPPAL